MLNSYQHCIINTLTPLFLTTARESGSSWEETGRRASNVSPWINSQGKIPREKANGGDQTRVKGAVIPPQFLLIVLVVEAVTVVLLLILPLPRISGAFKRGHPIVNRLAGRRGWVDSKAILWREGWGVVLSVKETWQVYRGQFLIRVSGAVRRGHPTVNRFAWVCVCGGWGGGGVGKDRNATRQ